MIKKKTIHLVFMISLLAIGFCSPGDIIEVDKTTTKIFEMKKSGDLSELPNLFHPEATSDLNLEFFEKLFSNQKNALGDYVSHSRQEFNFQTKNGVKTMQVAYEVEYSKVKKFYEKFAYRADEEGVFKLVGYKAREKKEDL